MRWLVTGGAGFIGVNVVRALLQRGDHVRVLDSLVAGVPDGLDRLNVELCVGDIRDESIVPTALAGVESVIHLAAQTGVPASVKDPIHDFQVNATGTLGLLRACQAAGVRRFVLASSLAPLAGSPAPLTEDSPVRPLSPYGASKASAEACCSAFGARDVETVVLRFSNVYGPWSTVKSSVIASLIRSALAGDPLVVHGDGHQTRDFIHVDDLVRAVVLAGTSARAAGQLLHVATGTETPVISVAESICRHLGVPTESITFAPVRAKDPTRSVAMPRRANDVLGWHPTTSVPDGIAQTAAWFAERWNQPKVVRP